MKKFLSTIIASLFIVSFLFAGNPDRQGEAGAYELLMNPWARSAGLHTMNTANITGVEAMRLNVAGIGRINKSQFVLGNTTYLQGTDIRLNSFGLSQKIGKSGAFGLSLMAVDFGDINVTTTDQPEGTGATFSPSFFHLGLGYAHTFENKISVGVLFRAISETTANLSAFGFAIDAGVQYVTGEQDNFKFGISLRNIGSKMQFRGEGLSFQTASPNGLPYETAVNTRTSAFEIPSALNIGGSYDILFPSNRVTIIANFTSNSFSQDQLGAGLEYALNEMFMLRAAYKYTMGQGQNGGLEDPVYTGLSAGLSLEVPFKKGGDSKVGFDYAYRATNPWSGTHNIGIRLNL